MCFLICGFRVVNRLYGGWAPAALKGVIHGRGLKRGRGMVCGVRGAGRGAYVGREAWDVKRGTGGVVIGRGAWGVERESWSVGRGAWGCT
jgi:hypothetical protein